jgi:hypothetical protein
MNVEIKIIYFKGVVYKCVVEMLSKNIIINIVVD